MHKACVAVHRDAMLCDIMRSGHHHPHQPPQDKKSKNSNNCKLELLKSF